MHKFVWVAVLTVLVILAIVFAVSIYKVQAPKLQPATGQPAAIVGGDRDAHGCIGSAGYSWCEVKQKCLRVWEEKCDLDRATGTLKLD